LRGEKWKRSGGKGERERRESGRNGEWEKPSG